TVLCDSNFVSGISTKLKTIYCLHPMSYSQMKHVSRVTSYLTHDLWFRRFICLSLIISIITFLSFRVFILEAGHQFNTIDNRLLDDDDENPNCQQV
ncbi:hypothetical protein L9F63_012154, partial [Diploptera punctata]